ncbi:hypothetical protein CJF32_00009791 [Rutstroemia sp. NJR-2017a WRK4]|nr:hypothetical protein CJF32_00009791 [Rutstroemia sp. NJR-2017a WRK4]
MADESSMDPRHGTNVDCPGDITDTTDLGNKVVIENGDDKEDEVVSLGGIELSRSDRSLLLRSSGKHDDRDEIFSREQVMIKKYLLDNVPQFRTLLELRSKGWSNSEGDDYYKKQRYIADNANKRTTEVFMSMMRNVARKMHEVTNVFSFEATRPSILGLGFAPGGKIETALKVHSGVQVHGITLPSADGGIDVLIRPDLRDRLKLDFADVTMMATDLGFSLSDIPADHPDAGKFCKRLIRPRQVFDLVTCEGGVLRTHRRALYRERREAHRLRTAQLALALERVKVNGRMIVLMQHAEDFNSVSLFYSFRKFAKVSLFKHHVEHQHRSSFYMIVSGIQSQSDEALRLVKQWKREWYISTFGSDEEYIDLLQSTNLDIEVILAEFGHEFAELATPIWEIQSLGLERKSFVH